MLGVLSVPDSANAWIVGLNGLIYKGVPSTAGITNMSLNIDVSLYPNPTSDRISVELNSAQNEVINYSLLEVNGRTIEQGRWNKQSSLSKFVLDLSQVGNGLYFLKLNTESGQGTFRVIKE